MESKTKSIGRSTTLKQSDVMDGFARCQSILFDHIRQITDENKGQEEMTALKTKRIIQKWFRQDGRL